jgi:hypothetical protein
VAALGSPHVLLHDGILSYPAVAARSWSTTRLAVIVGTGYAAALLHQAVIPVAPLWLLGVAPTSPTAPMTAVIRSA